jgi:hypothetical protein
MILKDNPSGSRLRDPQESPGAAHFNISKRFPVECRAFSRGHYFPGR